MGPVADRPDDDATLAAGVSAAGAIPVPASAGPLARLHHRLATWRNRRLADPAFQRWAARFPLTRPVARQRARALFDLTAGFVYSQVLFACVELQVFQQLDTDGPRSAENLAPALGLTPAATRRLLDAAAALDLVAARPGGYALGPGGAALLGNAGVFAMIRHHALLYRDLADPVALLRGEVAAPELQRFWAYARAEDPAAAPDSAVTGYSALMAATQPMIAEEVLAAYSFRRHRRILDVGGGHGAFLTAVLGAYPHLQGTLFDLPSVAARGHQILSTAGFGDRVGSVGGSFLHDPLPTGADAVSLVRIVHDHDDAAARTILGAVRAALPPGGTLILAEPMAGIPGAAPIGDAYFGFYLLAMGSGRARTPRALTRMLRAAGFTRIRCHATNRPALCSVLTARAA